MPISGFLYYLLKPSSPSIDILRLIIYRIFHFIKLCTNSYYELSCEVKDNLGFRLDVHILCGLLSHDSSRICKKCCLVFQPITPLLMIGKTQWTMSSLYSLNVFPYVLMNDEIESIW